VFFIILPYDAAQSGGTAGSGQLTLEDGDVAWQRPAALAPGLGLASEGPSLGRLAWAQWRTEHSMARQGQKRRGGWRRRRMIEVPLGMVVAERGGRMAARLTSAE
jgi:hypothetical protein